MDKHYLFILQKQHLSLYIYAANKLAGRAQEQVCYTMAVTSTSIYCIHFNILYTLQVFIIDPMFAMDYFYTFGPKHS